MGLFSYLFTALVALIAFIIKNQDSRFKTQESSRHKMLSAESLKFLTEISPMAGYALMAVGSFKVAEHGLGLVRGLWKHIVRPRRWLKSRYTDVSVEPWAVISGK